MGVLALEAAAMRRIHRHCRLHQKGILADLTLSRSAISGPQLLFLNCNNALQQSYDFLSGLFGQGLGHEGNSTMSVSPDKVIKTVF